MDTLSRVANTLFPLRLFLPFPLFPFPLSFSIFLLFFDNLQTKYQREGERGRAALQGHRVLQWPSSSRRVSGIPWRATRGCVWEREGSVFSPSLKQTALTCAIDGIITTCAFFFFFFFRSCCPLFFLFRIDFICLFICYFPLLSAHSNRRFLLLLKSSINKAAEVSDSISLYSLYRFFGLKVLEK